MKKLGEKLSDDDLASIVRSKLDTAGATNTNILSSIRANHLATYFRHGYPQDSQAAEEDRSTTVDSTASDTVDWMMAQLMRTFMGGERVVNFIPTTSDDVDQSEIEMDVVEHIMKVQNDGYVTFFNWIWDGLVTDVGYVKAFRDERVVKEVEEYSGLTEDALTAMIGDLEDEGAEVEIVSQLSETDSLIVDALEIEADPDLQEKAQLATEVRQAPEHGPTAVEIIRTTYEVKLRIARVKKMIKVLPVPGDEVVVPKGWTSINLKDAPFCGHVCGQTPSELVSQGFDPEQIEKIPAFGDSYLNEERQTRHENNEGLFGDDEDDRREITEAYVRVDRDGDGYDELLQVVMGGNEILRYADGTIAVEEIEEIPLHSWSPYMIPHRHQGEGVVSRTSDIQRNRTGTERALMDNMAFTSNPRTVLGKGAIGPDTISDALIYRPGGILRADDASQVSTIKLPSIIQEALPVLEYWDQRKEERTGVTRYNQGLDADSLNKTATGAQMIKEAGLDKVEMIARNLAETGYKSLVQHIHALLRRHQDRELELEVSGRWIKADPREWGDRSNMRVGVGLGAGSRERKQAALGAVIERQSQLLTAGAPITDTGKLYNALKDWASGLGIQDPNRYFTDPDTLPPAEPQAEEQTPEQALASAQVEAATVGAQAKLIDVKAKAEASQRSDHLKLIELQAEDDRSRDEALLRAIVDLRKANMSIEQEEVELRKILTPEVLARFSTAL